MTDLMEREERARRAYTVAAKKRRQWEAVARAFARNPKLKLELSWTKSATDNKTIWIRVPIQLGDQLQHDGTCGYRNSEDILTCEACAIAEDIDITVIHEVAHMTCGSFEKITDHEARRIIKAAVQHFKDEKPDDDERAKLVAERIEKAVEKNPDFMNVSNAVSPHLPFLLNVCEDVRVNTLMSQQRPGTEVMFRAMLASTFAKGTTQPDGSVLHWRDAPANAQAAISLYLKLEGLSVKGRLADEIAERLEDPELDDLVEQMKQVKSAGQTFKMALPIFMALRRLGFLHDEEPEEQESKDESQADEGDEDSESGDSDGEQASDDDGDQSDEGSSSRSNDTDGSSGSLGDDDQDSDDQAAGSGNQDEQDEDESADVGDDEPASPDTAEDGDSSAPDDEDGEPPTDDAQAEDGESSNESSDDERSFAPLDPSEAGSADVVADLVSEFAGHGSGDEAASENDDHRPDEDEEAMERAFKQADFFDRPSLNIEGVIIHKDGVGGGWDNYGYGRRENPELEISESILAPSIMRLRRIFTNNARGAVTQDLKSGKVNARVLAKRVPTGDPRIFQRKTEPGKKDYFVLIGVDVSGSTSNPIHGSGTNVLGLIKQAVYAKAEMLNRLGIAFAIYAHSGDGFNLVIHEIKSPRDKWGKVQKQLLQDMNPYAANIDGHTLEYYRKVMEKRHEAEKLILYYTDGAMPAENYAEELQILRDEIELCKKLRINLVGVGVRSDAPLRHGLDTILLDNIEDVPKVVKGLQERLA